MMRTAVVAVVIAGSIAGLCIADPSLAMTTRANISVPPQNLALALQSLARDANFQVVCRADLVEDLQTEGVTGLYSPAEALGRLLVGTGLTYRTLDDKTVMIVPIAGSAAASDTEKMSEPAATSAAGKKTRAFAAPGTKGLSGRLRLAQSEASASQGTAEGSSPAENGAPAAEGRLDEIVVTAQKREERLQNVPISISVLSSSQLESPLIASATDALSTLPGVAVNQAYLSGGTQVTIRGVSVAAPLYAGSSPTAYYLDAMPFGLVKSAIAPDQDVYDLQRIEVLRGPQGTLYGASALNGVVRIITNDADPNSFDLKARVSDSYTRDGGNNYRGDAAANVPIIDGKLAVRAVVGYARDSGYIDTPIESRFNDSELKNYRLKVNARPTEQFNVGLSYWGARGDFGGPSNGNDEYRNSSVIDQEFSTRFDAYVLKLSYELPQLTISNTASYLDYGNLSGFDFASLVGFPFVLGTTLRSHVTSNELLLNSAGNGVWRWSAGATFRRATEDRFNYVVAAVPGFILDQNTESESYALYGEVTRLLMDGRLEATAGLRWFEDRQTQDGATSPTGPQLNFEGTFVKTTPRAVLTWHQNPNWTLYGSFSEGFRSGVLQDFGVPIISAKADTLYNYELGTKGNLWNGLLNFESAVYYMNWKNVQQSLNVPYNDVYTGAVVNGESASGPGIDVSLTAHPATGLTLGVTGSWNKLELDEAVYSSGTLFFPKGGRLNSSPETTASASGDYLFPIGGSGLAGRVSASLTYTSQQIYRVNPGGPVVLAGIGDPITVGRLALSLESAGHWTATLFANNINNQKNAIVRPFDSPDLTARIRPMTAGLQVDYRFSK